MSAITVIGCTQVDLLISPVTDLPPPGTAVTVDELHLRAGGAGANTGLAFVELAVPVRLVGCVGDDHLGRWMLEQLSHAVLDAEIEVVPGEATGVTVATEAPGLDRTFLTYLGVNSIWSPSMISDDALDVAGLLLCDYFWAPGLQGRAAMGLLDRARAYGATTYFDTSWDPDGWSPETRRELLELLARVDVFLPNEDEARALVGEQVSVEDAAALLQRASSGWVVVKRGAEGCLAIGPGGEEHRVAAPRIEVVDSTGAGDAFNAGLIAALTEGQEWPDALLAATELAATLISRPSDERHRAPAS